MSIEKIPRFNPVGDGAMGSHPEGRYVRFEDVTDLLNEVLGPDRAKEVIHEYFDFKEEP